MSSFNIVKVTVLEDANSASTDDLSKNERTKGSDWLLLVWHHCFVGWPCYAGAWILPWSVCSHSHCFAVLKVRELLTFPCCISATWKYIQYTGCNLERWKHWIFFCGSGTPDWQEPHLNPCSSGELWVSLSFIQNWTPKKHLMTWWGCHM